MEIRGNVTKKYPLSSGTPCLRHKCNLCCVETKMPLSRFDIKRILKMGYRLKDFAIKTAEGWQLKNRSGRCVFLGEEGCEIYPHRPEGCRLYPLVYDEALGTAVLDDLCSYKDEFKVSSRDIERLFNLLVLLEKERGSDNAFS